MPVSHTVASHFLARLRSPAQGAVVDVAWFDAGDVEPGEQLVPASRRVIIPGGGNIDVRRQVTQRVMAGLDPAIPASTGIAKEAVTGYNGAGGDGRVKPGHDGWNARHPEESILSTPGIIPGAEKNDSRFVLSLIHI